MRIGFLDSGIGGLTLLAEALGRIPGAEFLYFADTASVPYGDKSREQVRACVLAGVEALVARGIEALVVACNTATAVAIEDLRRTYAMPIIGMEPAVKPALALARAAGGRVRVLATDMTLREDQFHRLVDRIDEDERVDHLSLQGLVAMAEAETFAPAIVDPYLQAVTAGLDLRVYSAAVLGCTHFPYFRSHLRRLFPPGTALVDGHQGTLNNLIHRIGPLPEGAAPGGVSFLESGPASSPERFHRFLALLAQA